MATGIMSSQQKACFSTWQHDFSKKILLVQLCPMVINEVEALNVNISALEGESWNCLLDSSLQLQTLPSLFF